MQCMYHVYSEELGEPLGVTAAADGTEVQAACLLAKVKLSYSNIIVTNFACLHLFCTELLTMWACFGARWFLIIVGLVLVHIST